MPFTEQSRHGHHDFCGFCNGVIYLTPEGEWEHDNYQDWRRQPHKVWPRWWEGEPANAHDY